MTSSFKFEFNDKPESYHRFFFRNNLYDKYRTNVFEITGSKGKVVKLELARDPDSLTDNKLGIYDVDNKKLVSFDTHTIISINIMDNDTVIASGNRGATGGSKKPYKLTKKEILGKLRCIYKVPGSRKEHVKHKGYLITVTDYKKLMKAKTTKAKPTKTKK